MFVYKNQVSNKKEIDLIPQVKPLATEILVKKLLLDVPVVEKYCGLVYVFNIDWFDFRY